MPIPKSDRADSKIRPCGFRNQTVRFRNQTVHFRNQTVCFRNQTVCFEIRPCVSESDRAFSRKSDRVFPETHRCDFFSRRGVFLESDRAFSGIRPCRFRNQTVPFPETTVRFRIIPVITRVILNGISGGVGRPGPAPRITHSSACHECIGLGYVFMDPLRSVIFSYII